MSRYVGIVVPVLGIVVLSPVFILAPYRAYQSSQYRTGRDPGLYRYLERVPKDAVIASLSKQSDLFPSFAKRSVLTGYEYGIPYHLGYYGQIRQRTHDLVRAQYSADPATVRQVIERYGVTLWLLNKLAFTTDYIANNSWIRQTQPEGAVARAKLNEPTPPVLQRLSGRCLAYRGLQVILVDAGCVKSLAAKEAAF
jgi:hypothetical protein